MNKNKGKQYLIEKSVQTLDIGLYRDFEVHMQ